MAWTPQGLDNEILNSISTTNIAKADNKLKEHYRTLDFSSVGLYVTDNNNGKIDTVKNKLSKIFETSSSTKANINNIALRRQHQMTLYLKCYGENAYNGGSSGKSEGVYNYVICSNLPESYQYTIGGTYSAPMEGIAHDIGGFGEVIMQALGGTSKIKAGTIQLWNGGKAFTLTLKIPVLDDGWDTNQNGFSTNFMEALHVLSRFCLPTSGGTKTGKESNTKGMLGNLGSLAQEYTYNPPPNPVSADVKYYNDKNEKQTLKINSTPGKIMCQLGGMLLVDNCVLKDMQIEYPNTKAMIRHDYQDRKLAKPVLLPIVANLTLTLEVPIMLTAEMYRGMLWQDTAAQDIALQGDLTGLTKNKREG